MFTPQVSLGYRDLITTFSVLDNNIPGTYNLFFAKRVIFLIEERYNHICIVKSQL